MASRASTCSTGTYVAQFEDALSEANRLPELLAGLSFSVDPFLCPEKSGKYQVIKMAAQHGGFRKGADRPKGSRNRATIALEAWQREALAAARAENANLSAIDYLLQTLPTTPPGRRAKVTMFVAPYLKYRVRVSQTAAGEQNQGLSAAPAMPRRGLARAAASSPTPQFKTIQLGLNDRPATL